MDRRVFSVSQINGYIRSVFDDDMVLNNIFIEGEISNYKAHPSGHMFFVLKDAYSQISCVMFKTYAEHIAFAPENGMKTILYGRVSAYEKTGQYQFYAEMMEPSGVGAYYIHFEQLKQKLFNEGLFDDARKKPLPLYPRCVAVITSKAGAAVQDIIQIIARRNKTVKIVVIPTNVQGEKAPDDIVAAIKAANAWGGADCIIIGRGGGSAEDLQAFNDENVARAVAGSRIPVVSAVGHETDYCITDFVSDLRAPTPSAAAELVTPLLSGVRQSVYALYDRLNAAAAYTISRSRQTADLFAPDRMYKYLTDIIESHAAFIASAEKKMSKDIFNKLSNERIYLENKTALLESLSPDNILKRGYAYIMSGQAFVTQPDELKTGQTVTINMHKATAEAEIKGVVRTT